MDDSLYDTSWTLYTIPSLTSSFRALFTTSSRPSQLDNHAESFRNALGRNRPRYEDEEEKEKLGGLRSCTWTKMQKSSNLITQSVLQTGKKRKRESEDDNTALERGLLISLVYEKATYKFVLFTSTTANPAKRTKTSTLARSADKATEAAIVLAKASSAAFKAFQTYFFDTFAITDIYPLKLPPSLLLSTLEDYISGIYTSLSQTASQFQLPLDMKAILGTLKFTLSFSAPVAPSLKTLDLEVPSESVLAAFTDLDKDSDGEEQAPKDLMEVLSNWVHEKTGLKLPLRTDNDNGDADQSDETSMNGQGNASTNGDEKSTKRESPMRISRIMSAAYAISSEGRLKFALKPAETCDDGGGRREIENPEIREGNVVRQANEALLVFIMMDARRQRREEVSASAAAATDFKMQIVNRIQFQP